MRNQQFLWVSSILIVVSCDIQKPALETVQVTKMNASSRNEAFGKLVEPLVRKATALKLTKTDESTSFSKIESRFGGPPYAEAGEVWPICKGCEKPLSFICQVNLRQLKHPEIDGVGLFTFFYCWPCRPWGLRRYSGQLGCTALQRFVRIESALHKPQ